MQKKQTMSGKQIDIYIVQYRDTYDYEQTPERKDALKGQLYNLKRYFGSGSIYVKDVDEFITQVFVQVVSKGARIRNLVIAAHGSPGVFYIGKNSITAGEQSDTEFASLRLLAPFFAKDANVYVLACRTAQREPVLQRLSHTLGGVKVHGYTAYIETTNNWISID